jgi:hypothetical protein
MLKLMTYPARMAAALGLRSLGLHHSVPAREHELLICAAVDTRIDTIDIIEKDDTPSLPDSTF